MATDTQAPEVVEMGKSEPKGSGGVAAGPGRATESLPYRILCANWCTNWTADEQLRAAYPPRHSDYRDTLPEPLEVVYRRYQPYVQDGKWTLGLLEMWFPRAKAVKHSVHIPCWDSFRLNPCAWRGACFGRTCTECLFTGLRQTRWARGVYAASLGREYRLPVQDIGRHGYLSDIKALFGMYFAMGCVFSFGIGQAFSLCGNLGVNFAACYSCHAREKMRRKWGLPPAFCLPPGIDDCLVHFLCTYCASHQELRELAVRGIDGPGLHILDVLPESYEHNEGFAEAYAARKAVVDEMLRHPPKWFRARAAKAKAEADAKAQAPGAAAAADASPAGPSEAPAAAAEGGAGAPPRAASAISLASSGLEGMGWVRYGALSPPQQQDMVRPGSGVEVERVAAEPLGITRAWSVSY